MGTSTTPLKEEHHYVIFQDDPRMTLEEKVAQGAAMFKKRFKVVPTTCWMMPGGEIPKKVGPVELRTMHNALWNHFWFSVEEDQAQPKSGAPTPPSQ